MVTPTAETVEAAAAEVIAGPALTPPYVQAEPPPGWASSEFISTLGVHVLNLLAVLLDMLHVDWHRGLSALQGLIPMVALLISAVIQIAYQNHRTQLKITHVQQTAQVKVEQLKAVSAAVAPTIGPALAAAEGLVTDPEVKARLAWIEDALRQLQTAWAAPTTIVNNVGQDVTAGPSAAAESGQQDLVAADPTVLVAPVVPADQLADPGAAGYDPTAGTGDPTAAAPSDPTAGGLYLAGDAAVAQLAAENAIPPMTTGSMPVTSASESTAQDCN